MRTNLEGVSVNIKATGEFIPYCNFSVIDKFITYLRNNCLIEDYGYQDLLNFLGQLQEG